MAEEIKTTDTEVAEDEIDEITNLKKQLADLRESTVSKERYEKLRKAYAENGESTDDPKPVTEQEKYKYFTDAVDRIDSNKGNNLEQAEDILLVRDYMLEKKGVDIFLPQSGTIAEEDMYSAERHAEILRDCIQMANGDSEVFNAAFGSRITNHPKIKV